MDQLPPLDLSGRQVPQPERAFSLTEDGALTPSALQIWDIEIPGSRVCFLQLGQRRQPRHHGLHPVCQSYRRAFPGAAGKYYAQIYRQCQTYASRGKDASQLPSAGLRVLLSAQKIMGKQGEMKVTHVGETIMEIFEVTGFSDILAIE